LRANTFGPELTKRKAPRLDTPEKINAPVFKAAKSTIEPPIEGAREALLMYVDQLPGASPIGSATTLRGRKITRLNTKGSSKIAGLSAVTAEAKLAGLRKEKT
jgi:hypothetical protein